MPRLTFPHLPDGLLVPALVGLSASAAQRLQPQGVPLPAVVRARGIVDRRTTMTGVAPWILSALQARPEGASRTTTVGGVVNITFYRISFTIYHLGSAQSLSRVDWPVTSLPHNLDDMDILFGLDLLREIVLTVNGPAGELTLDF